MILTYANGSKTEAFLLSQSESKIRVVVPGCDDPMELTKIRGTWVSEDCEPVRVEFAWENKSREQVLTEADCICPQDLAARLIHLLWAGSDEKELQAEAPLTAQALSSMNSLSRGN